MMCLSLNHEVWMNANVSGSERNEKDINLPELCQ